jgi:hypothetical protein
MSLSQYQTLKISDTNYSVELNVDSANAQKMKCSVRFYKPVTVDGYGELTVYPKFVIDTTGDSIVSDLDITYKVEHRMTAEVAEEAIPEPVPDVVDEVITEPVPEVAEEVITESVPEVVEEVITESVPEVVDEVIPESEDEGQHADFVIEDQFIDENRWTDDKKEEALLIEEIKIRENKKVEDLLALFNQQMEAIMEKLDSMKNRDDVTKPEAEPEPEEERPLPPIPQQQVEEERPLPPIPKSAPHPPTGPRPPPGPPPAAVAHVHHAPKIEIVEEANIRQSELKPRPPVSESPLNSQISKLQMTYVDSIDIDKKIVKVIIDHMKCIEHFDLSGPEKKSIVLNSIETILIDHSIKDYTFILDLSSQLIDTFIAFDKDKIHIIEKASALSCFPCAKKL